MTTFTTNDPIFQPLKNGGDPRALQNLVNALNQNAYANASFAQAVQRGDFVFELVEHGFLARKGATALYSNDRGSSEFVARGNKFAIQLDNDWFIPQSETPAFLAAPKSLISALGILTHEADHSNRQPLFDEANKLASTFPASYRPDLTGAARVAASVDLTMKAEVAGWYADLNTLRTELADGRLSPGQYRAYTAADGVNGKLIAAELMGQALGLSGDALANYVADHGKKAIPSDYVERYLTAFESSGVDSNEVRKILTYSLNDPGQVKDFSEEVGPDGTYISSATYNNGERITTVIDGYRDSHSTTKEVAQADGSYRIVESNVVSSYNGDGSFGDQVRREYDSSGHAFRVTETDGAHRNASFDTRTTLIDGQGRPDWVDVILDDGSRDWNDYDENGSQGWSRVESHIDRLGRTDHTMVYAHDGSRDWHDYDQDGSQGWAEVVSHIDPQGRTDYTTVYADDGSRDGHDYDQDGSQGWTEVVSHVDRLGRTDYTNVYADDGSRDLHDYDEDGSQGWTEVVSHIDRQGRTDYVTLYADDGSRDSHDYDQDGSQGWTEVVSHIDRQGRTDYATVYADDGSRNVHDYDQDGTLRWSNMESRFGANGRLDFSLTLNDDGSRLFVDYDHHGRVGEHEVSAFSATGRVPERRVRGAHLHPRRQHPRAERGERRPVIGRVRRDRRPAALFSGRLLRPRGPQLAVRRTLFDLRLLQRLLDDRDAVGHVLRGLSDTACVSAGRAVPASRARCQLPIAPERP